MSTAIDMYQLRFGRLLVIDPKPGKDTSNALTWRCECDCGTKRYYPGHKLRKGKIKSCGCTRSDRTRELHDALRGSRFGKLVVPKDQQAQADRSGSYFWICDCDCGRKHKVSTNALRAGNTRSCGCMKKNELAAKSAKDIKSAVRWIRKHQPVHIHEIDANGFGWFIFHKSRTIHIHYTSRKGWSTNAK
jgi:hypothetical protein